MKNSQPKFVFQTNKSNFTQFTKKETFLYKYNLFLYIKFYTGLHVFTYK